MRANLWRQAKQHSQTYNIPLNINYRYSTINSLQNFIATVPTVESLYRTQLNPYMYERTPLRGDVYEFKIENVPNDLDQLADLLYNVIRPRLTNPSHVRIYNDVKFVDMHRMPMFERDERPKHNYYNLARTLQVLYSNEYFDNYLIQIIPITVENPRLDNLFNGEYNCAIGPVIYHLNQVKGEHKNKIAKLKALQIPTNGANNELLQEISNISKFKISVVDRMGKQWEEFKPKGYDRGTILLEVYGKHLQSKFENVLYGVDAQKRFYDQFEYKTDAIEWHDDLTDILKLYPCAPVIQSKGHINAIFTPNKVYKKRFDEFETYPYAFGDASVGKAKFLEQCPQFENYKINCFDKLLLDSGIISTYFRTEPSTETNIKYDHNSSYKAFRQSGLFTGFPIINRCYNVKKQFSEFAKNFKYGLLHCNQKWMPIEIVRHNYITKGEDPYIFQAMEADEVFDFDENLMTNKQFRSFIGKTYTKTNTEIWRTNNYNEFLRARYCLRDKILHISEDIDVNGDPIYIVKYKTDRQPWAIPIIYTYVLRHQKFIIDTKLEQLDKNDIVNVCVDSIELKKPSDIFEIGTDVGQWKIEEINFNTCQNTFNTYECYNKTFQDTLNIDDDVFKKNNIKLPLSKYTTIEGPAGSGKSYLINHLKKIYKNVIVCASTHEAAQNIDGYTYHSIFGIGCEPSKLTKYNNMAIIDESSMISAEHLNYIIDNFPNYSIVLFGDFCQLPVVNGTPINEDPIYSKFTKIELYNNYRQQNDIEFYKLCSMLRKRCNGEEVDDMQRESLLNKLNSRVLPIPEYKTEDDAYICGVNSQVDAINEFHKDDKIKKVIAIKTTSQYTNGTRGILENNMITFINAKTGMKQTIKNGDNWKLNFASTAHKVQGKTYSGNVIINPTRLFEKNHLYVAITRATHFNNIYFTQPLRRL